MGPFGKKKPEPAPEPKPEPKPPEKTSMPTEIPEAVKDLGPEAIKAYEEAPETELTMEQWIGKTEQWIFQAMKTMKNHKESLEAFDSRLQKVEALEQRVADLEGIFRSAEEQMKKKNPNPRYTQ